MRKQTVLILSTMFVAVVILEAAALMTRPKIDVRDGAPNTSIGTGSGEPSLFDFVKGDSSLSAATEAVSRELSPLGEDESLLNLELVGTAMGNIKDARAFIRDIETGHQGIYKLGSTVRQAKIIRIAMGEVTLDANGKQEILRLSNRGKQWAHMNESDSPVTCVAENLYAVNRQGLMQEAGNVIKAMQQIKVKPHYEADKVAGMRVEGVPENSLIAAAGIKNSDVVTMVNSQKIDSYPKALQVLSKIRGQKEIQVSVLRNGQPQEIAYKIQ